MHLGNTTDEFDAWLYLTHLEATGEKLWAPAGAAPGGPAD